MLRKSLVEKVAQLDLSMIRDKLKKTQGWTTRRAVAAEAGYRAFLASTNAEPTSDVDIFWHAHIVDTMKYARDCKMVFGRFLHHVPSYQGTTCTKKVRTCTKRATCIKGSAKTTCMKQIAA